MSDHELLVRRMRRLLDADGDAFAPEQIEDLLALALLAHPPEERGEPDERRTELLGRFFLRAGLGAGASAAQVQAGVSAYFSANPPSQTLVEKMRDLVMELVETGALEESSAFARFMGNAPGGVLDTGERPEGTIPAGPLAAFQAQKKKE